LCSCLRHTLSICKSLTAIQLTCIRQNSYDGVAIKLWLIQFCRYASEVGVSDVKSLYPINPYVAAGRAQILLNEPPLTCMGIFEIGNSDIGEQRMPCGQFSFLRFLPFSFPGIAACWLYFYF
jgi:hypothetical protein